MSSRYPASYIKKRERESAYRRVVSIISGLIVFAVLGIVFGYFVVWKLWIEPGRTNVPAPAELAEERQQLETDETRQETADNIEAPEIIADSASSAPTGIPASGDVSDLPYSASFPPVQVSVSGSNTPASAPVDEPDSSATAASDDPHAIPEDSNIPASSSSTNASASNTAADPPQDSSSSQPTPETSTPADDSSSADTNPPPVESGGNETVFHVYAGSYSTKADADRNTEHLASLGFQSTLIVNKAGSTTDYLLRVASLADYDAAAALKTKLAGNGFTEAFATRSKN